MPARNNQNVDATKSTSSLPEPGQLVSVRQRHFVVLEVKKSNLPADPLSSGVAVPQHIMTLSSVEDDALGEELCAVWRSWDGRKDEN